ncbi:MAG: hypothetical protein NC311_04185 [Muribaculaceae bacterium]|nr:hypothetical protein [Muribaculaceae bacterium]
MKKTILFGAFVIIATVINAASAVGPVAPKKTKPQTLAQACSQTEIKTMCPAVANGSQEIGDCDVESIDGVSEQCSKFVKRAISKKKNPNQGAVKPKTNKSAKKKSVIQDTDAVDITVSSVSESN